MDFLGRGALWTAPACWSFWGRRSLLRGGGLPYGRVRFHLHGQQAAASAKLQRAGAVQSASRSANTPALALSERHSRLTLLHGHPGQAAFGFQEGQCFADEEERAAHENSHFMRLRFGERA